MILRVKNMVCPRCVESVKHTLNTLGIEFEEVRLGEIILAKSLSKNRVDDLGNQLSDTGFELILDKSGELVNQVKTGLIEVLEKLKSGEEIASRKRYLEEKTGRSYNYLSTVFPEVEGKTIEQFWIEIRLDYAKELLSTTNKSITQISLACGFSTSQYFATHFKKMTGYTPLKYRRENTKDRIGLAGV